MLIKTYLIVIKLCSFFTIITFPPNSTKLAKFCRHLATMIKVRVAGVGNVSFTKLNCLGFNRAGHRSRKNINPETTRVRTSRSVGHLATTVRCRQLQMKRTDRGHSSGDVKIDWVTWSRICNRNSAFVQASSFTSILVGFNSPDCLLSRMREIVSETADCKNA